MTPEWKALRKAALDSWRASLTPEQRADFEAFVAKVKEDREARRVARLARQAAREQRDAQIIRLAMSGLSTDEIAQALDMKPRAVRACYSRLGFERTAPGYRRTPCGVIAIGHRDLLHKIAAERGEAPGATLEKLLAYTLEDNALHARRLLRQPAARQA